MVIINTTCSLLAATENIGNYNMSPIPKYNGNCTP